MSEEITDKISSIIIETYYNAHNIKDLDKLLDESRNILEPLENLQQQLKIAVEALEEQRTYLRAMHYRAKSSTEMFQFKSFCDDAYAVLPEIIGKISKTLSEINKLGEVE